MKPLFVVPCLLTACLLIGCAQRRTTCESCCSGVCSVVPADGVKAAPADAATADALRAALADERRAKAWYEAVMDRHGRVRPFSNIVRAEERHAELVARLMERYSVAIPEETVGTLPAVPETVTACCKTAAELERENIEMYDRLLAKIREPDVVAAFGRLRAVSLNNHLAAFERFAQ